MSCNENPHPIVIIKSGKFAGEKAVLQFKHKDHWRVRLLDQQFPVLDRIFYDKNNKVNGTNSGKILICLRRDQFVKTKKLAFPMINTGNSSSFKLLNQWQGKSRTTVERYYKSENKMRKKGIKRKE